MIRTIKLDGTPSRVHVSQSGRLVGWTVFRTGDSYLPAGYFSTTSGIYDRATNTVVGPLEDFPAVVNGANFWGLTFAPDDRTFYATLALAGENFLIRGDLQARTLTPSGTASNARRSPRTAPGSSTKDLVGGCMF